MPVDWKSIASDPDYQRMQPSQRRAALEQLYAADVEPEARASGFDDAQLGQIKDRLFREADPDLYGFQGFMGSARELASGAAAGIAKYGFGLANVMGLPQALAQVQEGFTDPVAGLKRPFQGKVGELQKPEWYAEAEKSLTEQTTPLQKAGGFGLDLAALALPGPGELAAVKGVATGAKALMGAKLAKTALGGTAARMVSEVPAMMSKVGLLELLNTQDGKQAYEAAKSMAWIDIGEPGGFGIPGPAMWGPLISGVTAGKVLPGRTLVEGGGGVRRWNWSDRRSLTELAHESLPKWIMKGVLNSPPEAYRLGRDPEGVVVKEFGFFKEMDPITGPIDAAQRAAKAALNVARGGEQPITQFGWKKLFRDRINRHTKTIEDTLQLARDEGMVIDRQPVLDTFDDIENQIKNVFFGDTQRSWLKQFRELRKEYMEIGEVLELSTGNMGKSIASAQQFKIKVGKSENWYEAGRGFLGEVSKMRRQLYRALDSSIDDVVVRTRAKLENELSTGAVSLPQKLGQPQLPLGVQGRARSEAELKELIGKLGDVADLNDRIASLIDAEHAVTRAIKASRSDKAWFWFKHLGAAGAVGSAIASLNYLVPSPAWGVMGGGLGLATFTPMGRSLLAKAYPSFYGTGLPLVPMMATGIAKSPWTARAAGAAMLQSGPGGQPAAPAAPPSDPDPLKLRQ